jgi:excisionase family DNA binding protein
MKTKTLSIKELAAYLGVSTDTIRRAVRNGEIPATRVRTALRFDLPEVLTCMRRNAETRFGARSACAPGGSAGRAQADQPPSGDTGALPTGIVTGGLRIP